MILSLIFDVQNLIYDDLFDQIRIPGTDACAKANVSELWKQQFVHCCLNVSTPGRGYQIVVTFLIVTVDRVQADGLFSRRLFFSSSAVTREKVLFIPLED